MKYRLVITLAALNIAVLAEAHPAVIFTQTVAVFPDETEEELYEEYYLHLINNTSYPLEDVIRWTCDYLDIRNITICVSPQPKYYKEEGFVIKQGNFYYIYLKKNIANLNLILIHELIHVKQYETHELKTIGNGIVSFRGERINLMKTAYNSRIFEIEAHIKDSRILQEYYKSRKSILANAKKN